MQDVHEGKICVKNVSYYFNENFVGQTKVFYNSQLMIVKYYGLCVTMSPYTRSVMLSVACLQMTTTGIPLSGIERRRSSPGSDSWDWTDPSSFW